MTVKKKVEDAINEQIKEEMYSGYLYLSMAAWAETKNLKGISQWLTMQAKEELDHAMKFYHHLVERGGTVQLQALKKPPARWKSPLTAFEDAYKHECYITGRIHKLVKLAQTEKDYAFESFLKWFVDEQVEEEASTDEVVQQLKMIGNASHALLMFDNKMGARKAE